MKLNEQIEEARAVLDSLVAAQKACKHEWTEPVYDPEKKPETRWEEDYHIQTEYFYKEVPTGRTITTDRWSRTCKICGMKDYTYKSEVKRVLKAPIFDK